MKLPSMSVQVGGFEGSPDPLFFVSNWGFSAGPVLGVCPLRGFWPSGSGGLGGYNGWVWGTKRNVHQRVGGPESDMLAHR